LPEWQKKNEITQISGNDYTDFLFRVQFFDLCNRLIIGVIRDLKEED
jgi:hypothetical protein